LLNDQSLVLATDRFNPYRRCAVYWPDTAGWQRFVLQVGRLQAGFVQVDSKVLAVAHRYTFTAGQWQGWQQHQRLSATTAFIAARQQAVKDKAAGVDYQDIDYQTIDIHWYWWLLVVCGSLLWLERKLW
jgi:hypothetical protein